MSVKIGSITTLLPEFLKAGDYSKITVLVDENTGQHCYPLIKELLPEHILIEIKSGEEQKNLGTCQHIWQVMTDNELDRHSLMIDLGGGVIGDMGGFCAATYKRGIDFIQIPTTLLAQVDASVGGKLGIDFNGYKNHIGVFQLPKTVLIDADFLKSLPWAELRSGFAEVAKHCLIADGAKWDEIRRIDFDDQDFADLIAHSVEIKKEVVASDPTEKGRRKILNFGHTLGHAIETYFLESPEKERLLHGEAIAAGMICEASISLERGLIDESLFLEIEEFLFSIYGKVEILEGDLEAILQHTLQDKKNKGGQVRFSLLDGKGSCGFDVICNKEEMEKALRQYIGE
ncbi:3-dehydroquinate synthase [Jiulongibacter sediminis]|uniref:3-dehydroquinate synthase n=1 Tax=Jiulongibacter sediminis TaxID=1605367 RepID=A0A0P7C366_9BACT|nr:3-dehydroquinate synthase [Jiulongibacter sediminis]KPM48670.1 3-dehydroquinate synthase [Jiulongibacter sediminis]TBX25206.1 3-dehydroquinate synthase [Jiulongibacter sediminis]